MARYILAMDRGGAVSDANGRFRTEDASSTEIRMKKILAIVITSLFLAGNALAQTTATSGAADATGAAAGGITAGMVAAAVAVVAVAAAASTSNNTSTTTTASNTQ